MSAAICCQCYRLLLLAYLHRICSSKNSLKSKPAGLVQIITRLVWRFRISTIWHLPGKYPNPSIKLILFYHSDNNNPTYASYSRLVYRQTSCRCRVRKTDAGLISESLGILMSFLPQTYHIHEVRLVISCYLDYGFALFPVLQWEVWEKGNINCQHKEYKYLPEQFSRKTTTVAISIRHWNSWRLSDWANDNIIIEKCMNIVARWQEEMQVHCSIIMSIIGSQLDHDDSKK